ncbi:MAG: CHRD domain-containing protein [Nitrososphaeraceae archaeon]|nr:CHRD domain-containing protein [Nitrososphaeraceae archaeon]MDW0218612.1 CHRD domain-containing protein [Nitrososphaeraceae archaeon]MDW0228175.1 CHRD domain-containing protein [Nitrososphaeraceae archaeon]MDW0271823.1 CHRD domain-containing protein [Nitrososphaeraceae archaeon]MDW0296765.1 CHRD domain-containing protein [Nitrososphaeraceae archaeon]
MKWAFMYTIVATLAVIATSFVVTQQIQAQEGKMIITFLSGKDEVPPTESDATAWAKFQSVDNDSHLSYGVSIVGLKEITGAHIHKGSEGQNGDIVAVLSEAKSAEGGNETISLKGNITKDGLQGPLEGKEVTDLVSLMRNGSAYVNVHTNEYKDGVIRGQIG